MLHQLLSIKKRREQALRNEMASNQTLQQQKSQDIQELKKNQNKLREDWCLCAKFVGKIERKEFLSLQEELCAFQRQDEKMTHQLQNNMAELRMLVARENELRYELKAVLVSQEKVNYIINENEINVGQ
ncbi:hypothetical protein [Citrobacter youngae]|uniref:Uncharacterized protein n=1 Tax=Citrobacter youngae ATCC 29220 TaxID=500640 RepID=D4BKG7_9ENTR|nr:hypothetical protein [Citrobacter youngae]EFE05598.1 hypothetical protein CIT292_11044 [Citrobacter youngae ATCC 29220]